MSDVLAFVLVVIVLATATAWLAWFLYHRAAMARDQALIDALMPLKQELESTQTAYDQLIETVREMGG